MNKGEIKEIERTIIVPDHPNIEKINRDIKQNREYAKVITKYEKGVKQSVEIKKKLRF